MLAKKILDAILSHLAIRITYKIIYVIFRVSFHIINLDLLNLNLIISSGGVQNLVNLILESIIKLDIPWLYVHHTEF